MALAARKDIASGPQQVQLPGAPELAPQEIDDPAPRGVIERGEGHAPRRVSTVLDGGFCKGLSGSACGFAEIKVTFRRASRHETCPSDADRTAPKTCAGLSYDCECPSDMPFATKALSEGSHPAARPQGATSS